MHLIVRDFIKHIKLERRYSSHTVDAYQTDLVQFESFLKEHYHKDSVNWKLVQKRTVRDYLGWLTQKDVQMISVARKLAAIKAFFTFLSRNGFIDVNPVQNVRTPKFDKRLPEFISLEHLEKILDLPGANTFEGIRDRAILELFYASGIRRAELIAINISDIDLKEGLIRVIGKGEKERLIPIGTYAVDCLRRYLTAREKYAGPGTDSLFILSTGKKMYPMAVHRIIDKYLQKIADINKRSPHVLRHTFATHLMNQGADIRAVKDLLGHANLSTTQIYTHTSIEHLKKIYTQAHPSGSDESKKNKEV